jgi:hypothetical protein
MSERKCKKHPRYRGLLKPRVACEVCWLIFFGICETCEHCGCQEIELRPAPKW